MNKTELKTFAVSARRELLEKVALRAKIFGVDEKNDLHIDEQFGQLVINGSTYPVQMRATFQSLAHQLKAKGYEQLIEEVAYTWFNRIMAIRYMEVHDYLPERVNVLSSSTGKVEPDILSQFETMDLNINTALIKDLVKQGEVEQAFRKLFIAQCNTLSPILPFMFEKINDYTELLLPDFLLDRESIISKLVNNEELTASFSEVEVIGWLYQFYNSEPKDKVFAKLKKNKKIEKYDMPAATQLFTPKWIVQYMVENSLGQLWLESNPDSLLKQSMLYYTESAEQPEDVKKRLEEIRYKNVNLEEITFIDPCAGSGHILVYAFDLLYQMYEESGYPSGDISQLILEKNLYGLDVDDRAIQLASFALMMKARGKSRRIFRKQVQLNIHSIKESNGIDIKGVVQLLANNEHEEREIQSIIETFIDAKNYGSILQLPIANYEAYLNRIEGIGEAQLTYETFQVYEQLDEVYNILKQAKVLSCKYDVTVTNPPYMGAKGFNNNLAIYIKKKYPNSKADLYSVFIERCMELTKENGFNTNVTMHSWMFLSSFEKMRKDIIQNHTLLNILHLGMEAFEGIIGKVVQTAAFVFRKTRIKRYNLSAIRLVDYYDSRRWEKEQQFFNSENKYIFNDTDNFLLIPGAPIAYWATSTTLSLFNTHEKLKSISEPRVGLQTGDNDKFLKLWHEIDFTALSLPEHYKSGAYTEKKWFPYNKGGLYRKWYGNLEYVVNWENNGFDIKNDKSEKLRLGLIQKKNSGCWNEEYYFKAGITWSTLTTNNISFRYSEEGNLFDNKGSMVFFQSHIYLTNIMGFLNSNVASLLLSYLSPTLDFSPGTVANLPLIYQDNNDVVHLVENSIARSKKNWDSFEISWGFEASPLLEHREDSNLLSSSFENWTIYSEAEFAQLKRDEEELNSIFIDLYGLKDELTPKVCDEEITFHKSDRSRDSKLFLSYFIGCSMGRYSLDIKGLAYAGGRWDDLKYKTFIPNKFGLIRLTDEHYFEDDIIARLREFLAVTFSEETVENNLQWLAESLRLKQNETTEERLRRYFLDEFFKDHCQMYQKRPIYWLVDSGKQKGLRTLIYMHRYQPDTMATIRFEHLQEIQAKYNNEIATVDMRIVNPNLSSTEKRDLDKRKVGYRKRLEELLEFDKKLAEYANAQIPIDLNDGINVNFPKFNKVLAKIK